MKTAGLWIGTIAVLLGAILGVNWLFVRGTNAPSDRVDKAEAAVGYPLHDCHVSANDPTRIRCTGRGRPVRIDFTADGAVAETCIIGRTPDCDWGP